MRDINSELQTLRGSNRALRVTLEAVRGVEQQLREQVETLKRANSASPGSVAYLGLEARVVEQEAQIVAAAQEIEHLRKKVTWYEKQMAGVAHLLNTGRGDNVVVPRPAPQPLSGAKPGDPINDGEPLFSFEEVYTLTSGFRVRVLDQYGEKVLIKQLSNGKTKEVPAKELRSGIK